MDARMLKRYARPTESIKYKCKACKDTGYIMSKDEEGRTFTKQCICEVKARALNFMLASGLNEKDAELGFKDFKCDVPEQKQCLAIAMNYTQKFGGIRYDTANSLMFTGKSGRGKTMLAIITMNYLLNNGVYVLYISYRDTFSQLKRDMVNDKAAYEKKLNDYKDIELLVIDDLFKGKYSDADLNIALEIINYRYQMRKPIIISTELSVDEMIQIDDALAGRINQMCKNNIAYFGDMIKNYRL